MAQIRLERAGRYRAGYLTSDPDSWPASSRVEFVPGELVGSGAPSIDAGTWERTSGTETAITLTITPDDLAVDLKVLRGGVLLETLAGPFAGPTVEYVDVDPAIAEAHEYTARHTAGGLDGPLGDPLTVFAGPPAPASLAQTSAPDHFGGYEIAWVSGSVDVRVQDDFLCALEYVDVVPVAVTDTEAMEVLYETDLSPDHGTQNVEVHVRVRAEVETFSVLDVSAWVTILVTLDVYDDNADYGSCP